MESLNHQSTRNQSSKPSSDIFSFAKTSPSFCPLHTLFSQHQNITHLRQTHHSPNSQPSIMSPTKRSRNRYGSEFDRRILTESFLTPHLYRVQYRSSGTYYHPTNGFTPASHNTDFSSTRALFDSIHAHSNWKSTPSPFVALFTTKHAALTWTYNFFGLQPHAALYTISSDTLLQYNNNVFSGPRGNTNEVFVLGKVPYQAVVRWEGVEPLKKQVCETCECEFDLYGFCRCKVCETCTEYMELSWSRGKMKWIDTCPNCDVEGGEEKLAALNMRRKLKWGKKS